MPSTGSERRSGGCASTSCSASRAGSMAAAVGQKCDREMKVPRRSRRICRGKCRHADGSASAPASRWIAHSRPPSRSKNTQLPSASRATLHRGASRAVVDSTNRGPCTPCAPDRARFDHLDHAGLRRHGPVLTACPGVLAFIPGVQAQAPRAHGNHDGKPVSAVKKVKRARICAGGYKFGTTGKVTRQESWNYRGRASA